MLSKITPSYAHTDFTHEVSPRSHRDGAVGHRSGSQLAAMGDDVTVITSMPHYGQKQIASKYRGRLIHREKINGVEVWRTFVYVPPNHKGFYRAINYLSYTFMSIVSGILAKGVDVILCVNPPITVGFSGWLVSLTHRAPMVYNIQDVWPDCIAIIGQLRSRWLYRIFQHLEKFIYKTANRMTVLSEGMKQNLVDKRVTSSKITVIPNWADLDAVMPMEKNNGFRSTHGLDGKFVVMFAGNIGFISVLDTVLDAAKILKDRSDIQFLIVGEGNAKAALVKKADDLALPNVRFLPTQPPEVLPEMLAAADVSLVTLDRSVRSAQRSQQNIQHHGQRSTCSCVSTGRFRNRSTGQRSGLRSNRTS